MPCITTISFPLTCVFLPLPTYLLFVWTGTGLNWRHCLPPSHDSDRLACLSFPSPIVVSHCCLLPLTSSSCIHVLLLFAFPFLLTFIPPDFPHRFSYSPVYLFLHFCCCSPLPPTGISHFHSPPIMGAAEHDCCCWMDGGPGLLFFCHQTQTLIYYHQYSLHDYSHLRWDLVGMTPAPMKLPKAFPRHACAERKQLRPD